MKRAIIEFLSFALVLALEVLALFWVVSFFFGICAHAMTLTDEQRQEVESVVMAEAGGESQEAQRMIAGDKLAAAKSILSGGDEA